MYHNRECANAKPIFMVHKNQNEDLRTNGVSSILGLRSKPLEEFEDFGANTKRQKVETFDSNSKSFDINGASTNGVTLELRDAIY